MAYSESNGHVTDDGTRPRKVKVIIWGHYLDNGRRKKAMSRTKVQSRGQNTMTFCWSL